MIKRDGAAMKQDPREIINNSPMKPLQILAVGICIFLNALDGFDVLAITFAAPGIAEDWGLGPGAIGIMISAGLVGMGLGSLLLGPLADKYGRRAAILGCTLVMGVGMLLSATTTDMVMMSVYRLITGLGIGVMLAVTNAMTAEFANDKRRDFCVSIMVVGYPVGVVLGGSVAAVLLSHYEWQSVFIFGGALTLAVLPVVYFLLPESIEFLATKKGADGLEEINAILKRFGHSLAERINAPAITTEKAPLLSLFSPDMMRNTVTLTAAYFLHITTFYYAMGWVPSIITSLGFDKAAGASISVWVSIGGIIGGGTIGWLASYVGIGRLLTFMMFGTAAAVVFFGQVTPELELLKLSAFILGVFIFSGIVGLYALVARSFPTHLRSTGTGFVIGIGRAGAVISPAATGFLFEAGMGRDNVAIIMATGSLVAGIALILGKLSTKKPA